MSQLVFSRPVILWGLFAAGLPLIIHLINRHRARRRPFAAFDFLVRVQRQSARRILLRHILLLATRTLLLIALVLAAAGPVVTPQKIGPGPGPQVTALILDQSLSMRAQHESGSWFSAAQERARELVRGMGPGDKICLLAAGHSVETLIAPCTDSRGMLLDAIDGLQAQWGRSDLIAAIEKAAALTDPGLRIRVLTDAAAHAFGQTTGHRLGPEGPQATIENVALDSDRDNIALRRVVAKNKARFLQIKVQLSSFADRDHSGLRLQVRQGAKLLSRGFVDLPARGTSQKVFHLQTPSRAQFVTVSTPVPDRLAADNQWPVFMIDQPKLSVLLVNGDLHAVLRKDELFYLEQALSPAGGSSGMQLNSITPDRLQAASLDQVEVVFLANVRELKPAALSALRSFVSAGGGLFIALGNQVDVERSNRLLVDLLPWPLRDVVALGPLDEQGQHRLGTSFSAVDFEHPCFSLFRQAHRNSFAAIRTWKAAVLEPGQARPGTRVLLRYANGSPAMVERSVGNGRVILFTASLDRDWTSWPARASFLPFMQRAAAYLAGHLSRQAALEITVGEPVRIPLLAQADALRVLAPDGHEWQLPRDPHGQNTASQREGHSPLLRFDNTWTPGWYAIDQQKAGQKLSGQTIPGIIVRLPPAESDLTPITETALQERLGAGADITTAGLADDLSRSRSMLFILLALALILTEAVLARR